MTQGDQQPTWVQALHDKRLTGSMYRLLVYYLWRQGRNGDSFARQATISADLSLSNRQIRSLSRQLESLGWIIIDRPEKQGRNQYLHYRVKGGNLLPAKAEIYFRCI